MGVEPLIFGLRSCHSREPSDTLLLQVPHLPFNVTYRAQWNAVPAHHTSCILASPHSALLNSSYLRVLNPTRTIFLPAHIPSSPC